MWCGLHPSVCLLLYLKRLNEGPQQDADGVALTQQLDEASCSEEPQEAQVDQLILGAKKSCQASGYIN